MSPIPSRTLAARVASRLRAATLAALLLAPMPLALAHSPAVAALTPAERISPNLPTWPRLAAAGVEASMTAAPLDDKNGNGSPDPGETLRYTVVVGNGSGAALTGVSFADTLDPNTSLASSLQQISPLAFADSYDATRDTPLTVGAPGLLANDTGTPAPAVTPRSVTTAAGGSAIASADGGFSYTPPLGYTGIDSFSYSAVNSAGSDIGAVTLMVRAAPVAVDDVYNVARDTSRTVLAPGVLSNDSGFPPPTTTLLSGTTTAGGTVSMNANGGFNYSPPAGFTGADSFVYTAVNSAGSDTATVTLTVTSASLAHYDTGSSAAGNVASSSVAQSSAPAVPQAGAVSVNVGTIPAGKKVTIVFDVAIADPLPVGIEELSNQGTITGDGFTAVPTDDPHKPGAADPTITPIGVRKIYLATILHRAGDGPPLPDLVVSSITASGGNLQVTIRNNGQAAAVDAFWVDAYINPTTAPVRVNQLWNNRGARGAMWGVSNNALPLVPGETLTLMVNDSYYRPEQSNLGGPIMAGTQLYAQVDSFNGNGNVGAVRESHERDGGLYNNILGPVVAP